MKFDRLSVRDVRCVVRYVPRISSWHATGRGEHIIGIQITGKAMHSFDDRRLLLGPGTLYFLNRKDDYSVRVEEPGEAFSIHFTTWEEIETDSFFVPTGHPEEALRILEKAEAAAALPSGGLTVRACLYRLCAEMLRLREKEYAPRDGRLLAAREYMDVHFKEPACLAAATALTGLSSRRFGELFRRAFDLAPGRYLTERRLTTACRLLSVGTIPIAECAALCGFSDVYYFSKVFKKELGISPSRWRKERSSGEE